MNDTRQIISKKEYLKSIDFETKTITIRKSKPKKITGTRLSAVLGRSPYKTPFAAACDMVRLYTVVEETKYTRAGHAIEPKIRGHVNDIIQSFSEELGVDGDLAVEEPIPAEACFYDHFGNVPIFGGMVDGYVLCNGERCAVLEIKTAHDRGQWIDSNGDITRVPEDYLMQASLYCELSGLDKIVFAVGFLGEGEYDDPGAWGITPDNFRIVVVGKRDISDEMREAKGWYDGLVTTCTLPQWTDDDLEIVDFLSTKRLHMVSVGMEKLISEYVASGRRPEFEAEIKNRLVGYFCGSERKLVYEQEGFEFVLVRNDDTAELIVQPKP